MKNRATNKAIKKIDSSQVSIKKIVNFILEYRTLKHLPKACLPYLKGPINENIAEHSFYVTIIAWLLSKLEGGEENKIIKMCLVHDLAEARGGEKNLINKFFSTPIDEVMICKEVSRDYNLENLFLPGLLQEFTEEKTVEAKIAKDADILAQMLLEKECFDLGNFKAKRWLSTSLKRLKTKNGKELGKVLYDIDSDKWWLEIVKKYILKTKFLSPDEPFFHLP